MIFVNLVMKKINILPYVNPQLITTFPNVTITYSERGHLSINRFVLRPAIITCCQNKLQSTKNKFTYL